jgi:hypothetical protein
MKYVKHHNIFQRTKGKSFCYFIANVMYNLNREVVMKIFIFSALMLFFASMLNAQQNTQSGSQQQSGNKQQSGMGMGMSAAMQSCMDQIAADSTMRRQMMSRMMDNMKSDSSGMRQMFRQMMNNPEMHKMMMKMMNQDKMGSSGGMGRMMDEKDQMNDQMQRHGIDSTMQHYQH